jgi:hypothetical protein
VQVDGNDGVVTNGGRGRVTGAQARSIDDVLRLEADGLNAPDALALGDDHMFDELLADDADAAELYGAAATTMDDVLLVEVGVADEAAGAVVANERIGAGAAAGSAQNGVNAHAPNSAAPGPSAAVEQPATPPVDETEGAVVARFKRNPDTCVVIDAVHYQLAAFAACGLAAVVLAYLVADNTSLWCRAEFDVFWHTMAFALLVDGGVQEEREQHRRRAVDCH